MTAAVCFAAPGPGPGEPFGDNDTGCVPTSAARRCSDSAANAYVKLEAAIDKCHIGLASARFSEVVLGETSSFDEEACDSAAISTLDEVVVALEASSGCAS